MNGKKWLLIPVVLGTLFFYPIIIEGKTFYGFDLLRHFYPWAASYPNYRCHNTLIGDPVNVFYPYYDHLKSSFQEGVIPMWQNELFCGAPFTLPCSPVYYLIRLFLPLTTGHDVLLWMLLIGSGVFQFLYLREIRLSPLAASVGSVAWMFNGYVMVWFEFENVPMIAFSLPATLYAVELYFKAASQLGFLMLVFAAALSMGASHAHLVIYQLMFVGLYVLCRFVTIWRLRGLRGEQGALRPLLRITLAFFLAVVASSNFVTAHLYAFEASQRPVFGFKDLFQYVGHLPGRYILTLIFPDLFGSPLHFPYLRPGFQIYNNYNELCIYAGVPSLLFVCAAVPLAGERRTPFFLLTALITLTMAMGSVLYFPLASFVPGLSLSTPTRILYLFGFSMTVLSGLGAEGILTLEGRRKEVILGLWILVLGAGTGAVLLLQKPAGVEWVASLVVPEDPAALHSQLKLRLSLSSPVILKPLLLLLLSFSLLCIALFVRSRRLRQLFVGFTLVLLACDLLSFGLDYNTSSSKEMVYPETESIRFLKRDPSLFRVITYGKFLHNSFAPFGIADAGGYSSFYPKRYGEYLHLSQKGPEAPVPWFLDRWITFKSFGSPLLDLLNVKYLLLSPNVIMDRPGVELVYEKEIKIFENKNSFPRFFFVPGYRYLKSPEDAYRAIGRFRRSDFERTVVLEDEPPPGFHEGPDGRTAYSGAVIKVVSYQPNRIEVSVSTPNKGFLVMSENHHPAWYAEVDGQAAKILRANYIMRAIPLERGDHRLVMAFRPKLLMAGLAVSTTAWGLLCIALISSIVGRIRRSLRG